MNRRTIVGFSVGPIATAFFGLITVPAVAWVFTPEDVGRLNIANIAMSFSVLLFTLGLDQAYVREFHETSDHAALLRSCFVPGLIFFGLVALPATLFSGQLSFWLYGFSNPVYFWITLGCALAAFFSRFLSLILRMEERGLAFSMSQVIPKALLVALIALIVVVELPRDFLRLQLMLFASTAAVLLIYAWNTRRQWIPSLRASIDPKQLRALVKFGVPLNVAGVAYWGLAATSAVTLRSFSTFRELGIYSVAMSVAAVAMIFQSVFTVVWAPVVYKWVAQGADMSRVDRVARQALAAVCGVFVLCGMFSWLADFILPGDYTEVKYLVLCGIAQPLLYTLSEVTCVGIAITRRTMLSLWSTLAALVTNVALSVVLVPEFGAAGAMVANSLAFLVFFVARTEASAYVWRAFPRTKLYLFTIGAVGLAITTVIMGPSTGNLYTVMWAMALPLVAWAFRRESMGLLSAFKARRRSRGFAES